MKGEGNQQDYGMRIYDPRLGRFLSVDPLSRNYPFCTPYQFAGNMPIFAADLDGMEPDKIISKAQSLVNIPYGFGEKKPAPGMIGLLSTPEGRDFWQQKLLPDLTTLSEFHSKHYKRGPTEVCSKNELDAQWWSIRASIHKKFKDIIGDGDLGIDCSGFSRTSYQEDKELLFDPKKLPEGADGILATFKGYEKDGRAYVHNNFKLISAGDLVFTPGHVMVATGNVKTDENGKVVSFEVLEAKGTKYGSLIEYRDYSTKWTIGHPFRSSDMGPTVLIPGGWGARQIRFSTPSSDPATRTNDNLHHKVTEVIEAKEPKQKNKT